MRFGCLDKFSNGVVRSAASFVGKHFLRVVATHHDSTLADETRVYLFAL